ncbi:MAG: hypothetical protein EPO52_16835 [Herbiconiux sp.]|uniref:hypothetical protein n=1 Tax=Herbiconiux sp. TaxID=1871186 RepID=UPI0011FE4CFE|nr:hypothetical protein [Herbiconiux sp.]TAJ46208.1 MAG: hypothetical protein EPO52_16835 [Herbiconiux sp.]
MPRALFAIVSCPDWMEPCYDEQPPASRIDISSLLSDVHYFTICVLGAVIVVRLIAAGFGTIVVWRSLHDDTRTRNR